MLHTIVYNYILWEFVSECWMCWMYVDMVESSEGSKKCILTHMPRPCSVSNWACMLWVGPQHCDPVATASKLYNINLSSVVAAARGILLALVAYDHGCTLEGHAPQVKLHWTWVELCHKTKRWKFAPWWIEWGLRLHVVAVPGSIPTHMVVLYNST